MRHICKPVQYAITLAAAAGLVAAQTGANSTRKPSAAVLAKRKAAVERLQKAHIAKVRTPSTKGNDSNDPGPPPAGWTCVGNCGVDGADGSVTLSPAGSSSYEFVSTVNGPTGTGALPSGALGGETNGSTLRTPTFSATAGTLLSFYFNYVTSDGAGYADYAWAELFSATNTPFALLFTARTETSGSIVPGTGLPAPAATLIPASVPIIAGGPTWAPLDVYSGACYNVGCGYTGWVKSNYTIPAAGNYYLEVGVVNWSDTAYDSGLAVDGVTVGGVTVGAGPATTPAPPALLLALFGVAAVMLFAFARRQARA